MIVSDMASRAAKQLPGIEEVAACAARDERRELSGGKFVLVENQNLAGPLTPNRMRVARGHGPQRGSQHEVDVDLDAALPSERGRIGQPPLAAGMLGRSPLDGEAHAAGDLLQGLLDAPLSAIRVPRDVQPGPLRRRVQTVREDKNGRYEVDGRASARLRQAWVNDSTKRVARADSRTSCCMM